ncbi:thermonuclease family protein [Hoeflea sp. EC-HK425]|uniref:thermonuclease family protein n=1 Tax=Hoeflea sp. EC-HK425 TaxID=2038388 RepID=UPI001253945A|nr:thermonuclease family protein [Hoeflea sp. EC-HK425]VVT15352.1 conserved exported hypothetical protein [Hoeflea sp. EC-HK425]
MHRWMIAVACAAAVTCAQPAPAQTIEGTVTRVIDGDTFDFQALRIRLCGIDAPERGDGGHRQAMRALTALIEGRRVRCVPVGAGSVCDGRSKLFNRKRIVAQCYLGTHDIAARMVISGHACDWVKFSGGAYRGGCRK